MAHATKNTDFLGRPVPEDEPPDAIIRVWKIHPHLDDTYDYAVVRGFSEAVAYAKEAAQFLMDSFDPDEDEDAQVVISTAVMTRAEYDAIQSRE